MLFAIFLFAGPMKRPDCKAFYYPCIFEDCENTCCYDCTSPSLPYVCIRHLRKVSRYYKKRNQPNEFRLDDRLLDFKRWRKYERIFPIFRWPVFLVKYRRILRRYRSFVLKKISIRYWHYFKFYITSKNKLTVNREPHLIEEEIISDDEPNDLIDYHETNWHPDKIRDSLPPHKDSDFSFWRLNRS